MYMYSMYSRYMYMYMYTVHAAVTMYIPHFILSLQMVQ